MQLKDCPDSKHKFVHLRSESYKQAISRYSVNYVLIDQFFCEHCLNMQRVKKEHVCNRGQENLLPGWALTITNEKPEEY
jgi:hypothetical protein